MNARATVAECFNVLEKYTKHLAVCRFFEKLAMFVLAVGAYFSVRASDYPARWMTEYKVLVHKQCMLIWKSAPEEFFPVGPLSPNSRHEMSGKYLTDFESQGCGFLSTSSTSLRFIDAYTSSFLTSQVRIINDVINPENTFMVGGLAAGLCLLLEGCLLALKRRKYYARTARLGSSFFSVMPYFFYLPLNSQKSEDNLIWIRLPGAYELAASFLFFSAAVNVMSLGCAGICRICGEKECSQQCLWCSFLFFYVPLWVFLVVVVVMNFNSWPSFDLDFHFDFSFSIYLEVLTVLTWVALATDLVAGLTCLRWMCEGCQSADEDGDQV